MDIWVVFSYLQLLDILTTVAFLNFGVLEANPLIAWAIKFGGIWGLISTKLLVLILVFVAWLKKKNWCIVQANNIYMVIIVWNLYAIMRSPYIFVISH